MTLQTIPTAPESPEQSRNSRDIADYIGLASTGEMAELHHWVTQLQNSETKLAHSAQQQLSYLNHTVRRLNAQEDRINQLAFIDLKWEKTMRSLQKSRADVPEYLELVLTLIQGHSAVDYYEAEIKHEINLDITNLRQLASHQLPPNLISMEVFRNIFTNAPSLMPTGFTFIQSVETLMAKLHHLPVELLHDPRNHSLCAKLTIPAYISTESFQLIQVVPTPMQNPKLPGVQEMFDLSYEFIAVHDTQFFELNKHDLFDCENPGLAIRDIHAYGHLCVNSQKPSFPSARKGLSPRARPLSIYYPMNPTQRDARPVSSYQQSRSSLGWSKMYGCTRPAHAGILRFICPRQSPSPINLHPDGGRIVLPPKCSGITGQIKLPAYTSSDVHLAMPDQTHFVFHNSNSTFWIHNVTLPSEVDTEDVLQRVKTALAKSTHLSMPLDHFKQSVEDITSELDQNSITHFMRHNSSAPHAGTLVSVIILAALAVSTCCIGKCCWRRYRRSRHRRVQAAMPMVTFASRDDAQLAPVGPPVIQVMPDSPPPSRGNPTRVVVRRSRSRSRRAQQAL